MVKESESVTFRIPIDLLESLRMEAQEDNVSLNTLVNQVIIGHEKWHKYSKKAGFITIPKDFQKLLMGKVTNDEIIQITQQKSKYCKDIVSMLRTSYSLDSFLDVIETWFKICNFPYRKDMNKNKLKLTVQHNMGEKWSLFLSLLIQINLEKLIVEKSIDEKSIVEMTDETVIIEIPCKLTATSGYS